MASRAPRVRGLFETMEMKMSVHTFDLGDIVSVFQMSPAKGLINEGMAAIVEIVPGVDEYYQVKFDGEDEEPVCRFVDIQGQNDPDGYCWDFNKKLGFPRD